jgi:asparagine synthetase B (glutamine-hydrolysing)
LAGICGALGIEDKDLIYRMASLMEHRGEVIEAFADNGVTMALIRHSDEPKLYDNGSVSIALDQDIYALGGQLVDDHSPIYDHLVSGISYEDAIKDLRGGFALSIVEKGKSSKRLILARDIYGTRSMYYLKTDHALFFASEMMDMLKRFHRPNTYTETLKSWNLMAILLWCETFLWNEIIKPKKETSDVQ